MLRECLSVELISGGYTLCVLSVSFRVNSTSGSILIHLVYPASDGDGGGLLPFVSWRSLWSDLAIAVVSYDFGGEVGVSNCLRGAKEYQWVVLKFEALKAAVDVVRVIGSISIGGEIPWATLE